MIEVEMRGRLTKKSRDTLRGFLKKKGVFLERHYREQILLCGYPGYHTDPTKRTVDIRLRDTDGSCEIMIKRMMSAHNAGREEISLPLRDANLKKAKQVVKTLGFSEGLLMRRKKEVYRYKGVEWSIVDAGKSIYFFEAEKRVAHKKDIEKVRQKILTEIKRLGFKIFSPDQFHEFTKELGRRVNKKISW